MFDKWVVESGNTTLEDANSETTTFIMPDSEVSVKATYTIPHTHTYDQEIQKPETLKSAADCTNDAVYFKSCSCGEISTTETFTAAGTQLGHAWASDWSKDTDNHWKECSRCHEKKDEAAHDYGSDNICDTCGYDKTVPHTHNLTLVPAKAPTCTEKGNTAYYTCDGCDKWFEDATGASEITDKTSVILAATGHSASDWKSDNTDHWKECTVVGCGVIIEGSKAAHTAGEWIIDTPATATTSGSKHKECTVCGYTMATETIPATGGGEHTHSYGSEWKNDADNHWHECSCGDKNINTAINRGKQISFRYFHYDQHRKEVPNNDGKRYFFSPYCLVWNEDHYYAIGYSEKHRKLGTFRVDRMKEVEILSADAAAKPADFNLPEFTRRVFDMYDGETKKVTLVCKNDLMNYIVDRFGDEVDTVPGDCGHFRAVAEVSVSQTFFAWVFQFNGDIRITAPEEVVLQYGEMLKNALQT